MMYILIASWLIGMAYFTHARRQYHEVTTWSSIPKYFLSSVTWPLMVLLYLLLLIWPIQKE